MICGNDTVSDVVHIVVVVVVVIIIIMIIITPINMTTAFIIAILF